MDYKEKYEKALATAYKLYNEAKANGYSSDMEDYETIFPELRESEDEIIRKEIISAIKEDWPGHKDWIAWLEKHGETSPVLSNSSNIGKVEQKPLEMITPEESLGVSSETYNKIIDECIYGEQKPVEWSKEDLSMIGEIRSIIEKYAFSQSAVDVNGELCDKEFIDADNWLKSLKERVQPKSSWSEEDEKMLECAIDMIEWYNVVDKSKSRRVSDWLKSLRPQNTWKPSEEQMDALLSEVTAWSKGCPKQIVLESLYNDLKKL